MSARRFFSFLREYWTLFIVALGAMHAITTVMVFGAWAMFGGSVVQAARDELGISDLAEMVRELAGETRVTRQPPGQTYVREPVRVGDVVLLVLTISRTEAGSGCTYKGVVPLFTDESGVTFAGHFEQRGRQYGTNLTRTEMRITQPEHGLEVGRVTLDLQLEYECGGVHRYETLQHPAVFRLLPALTTQ